MINYQNIIEKWILVEISYKKKIVYFFPNNRIPRIQFFLMQLKNKYQ